MDINDELIELFAEHKLEDAYKAFADKHGYDPRGHANDGLQYCDYEYEDVVEEKDVWSYDDNGEEIIGIGVELIHLTYGELTRHDCPYSITTCYFLEEVKKEIRDIQIKKIL